MDTKRGIIVAVVGAALVGLVAFAVGKWASAEEKTVTPAEYQQEIVKVRNRVDYALEQMAESQSLDELTQNLDEAAEVAREAADDLDGMGVPDGLDDANDRLAEAFEGLAGELTGTAATLRDPNFEDVLPQLNSLAFPQWDAANEALADLKAAGIEVEPLSRY
ncbi:MAG TPA: hypothetical protein VI503_00690 [Gaiellaceae bacterium]|nr:hypothetical protein [Gaiellaceae bacterium]